MTPRRKSRTLLCAAAACLTMVGIAHIDNAQATPSLQSPKLTTVAALPNFTVPNSVTVTGPIPRTQTSIPMGTAYYPGAADSINLADYGYVEEEYFISGTANIYQYDSTGQHVEIKTPNVAYKTVILVRRPVDARKFSGRVQLEMAHPQFGATTQVWAHNYKMFMSEGDAWVRVTNSRGHASGASSLDILKQYDATRYASIDVPDDGLNWDIIGQVGEMLKSNAANSPLKVAGEDVQHVYMEGFSGAGAITLIWINDFSHLLRQPDGTSIMDGYVVGEPSGYPLINSQASPIPSTDPRQAVIPPGVPVVKLHSRPEPVNQRRPDSDAPADRYRTYETSGAAHTDDYTNPMRFPTFVQEQATAWAQANLYPFTCQYAMNNFPFENQWNLAINTIEHWSTEPARGPGSKWTPPHGQRIQTNPDGSIVKDVYGNDAGGVRSPAVDVPTATYYDTNLPLPGDRGFCSNTTVGHVEPFSKAKLKELYPTHAIYVQKVTRDAEKLGREGFLIPMDVQATIQAARQADVP